MAISGLKTAPGHLDRLFTAGSFVGILWDPVGNLDE